MARGRKESHVLASVTLFLILTGLTGLVFPAVLLGVAAGLFPEAAHGSLVQRHGVVVGSRLVGQTFDKPGYLWGRPSATAPTPYNAASSGGSNLGPLNPDLMKVPRERLAALGGSETGGAVPIDLLTASASGLDPDVSLEGALYQVPRVAKARGVDPRSVEEIVRAHAEGGTFSGARVNVLAVNLALDEMK